MLTHIHEFDWPDRVVVGTIGLPGARTFYLQVRAGKQLISIALEKQQAALLAEKIDEILDGLRAIEGNPYNAPTSTPIELVDNDSLEEVHEQFRAGIISLGWDPSTVQVVIEAHSIELVDSDDEGHWFGEDDPSEPELLLVRMPVGTARAFAKRTDEIVGAGRPTCANCGYPIDPDGHLCSPPQI